MRYSRAREYSSICWKKALSICGVSWYKELVVLFALVSAANRGFKGIDLPKSQIDLFAGRHVFPEYHKAASPVFQR